MFYAILFLSTACASNLSVAKGHTRHCGLVHGLLVEK